ncbi:MAG: hypothetical protein DAHOPDDO_00063 [Ignavibacteriaceae bacterium]|nr:hypothetical protein [Ignavibacteriaceae bacterium]
MPKVIPIPLAMNFISEKLEKKEKALGKDEVIGIKVLPLNLHNNSSKRNHWLALEFDAAANITLNTNKNHIIHQTWELKEEMLLENETEEQKKYLGSDSRVDHFYKFEFVGMDEYGTMEYDGEIMIFPMGAFHKLLQLYANYSNEFRNKFEQIIGLEYLHLVTLPDGSIGFMWEGTTDFFESSKSIKDEYDSIDLSHLEFHSTDHIRYEKGENVSGHNRGCDRVIDIWKDENSVDIFWVTIYNLYEDQSTWDSTMIMQTKRMKIFEQSKGTIKLKGFGSDDFGSSFEDYGITIRYEYKKVIKIILHLFDRAVDIEYFN